MLTRIRSWITAIATLLTIAAITAGCDDNPPLYFIGDSIVRGWNTDKFFSSYETFNLGVNGYHIEDCIKSEFDVEGNPTVILVGTNNLLGGYGDDALTDKFIAEFLDNYTTLIKSINASRCYVISILPRDKNKFPNHTNVNDEIQRLNAALKERVELVSSLVTFIDAYPLLEKDGNINMDYTDDGLHLNASGYAVLSRIVNKNL